MGLRIRTNIASVNAQRRMSQTTETMQTSMRNLSSGYRINRSADDAAGLAISENLKAQTRSMKQARRNANDGVSMIQVAEGSMNEVTNILIRLRELSVQAASDTIGNKERMFSNKEYVQLVDEIDRIASTTEFNGTKLLRGIEANEGMEGELTLHIGAGDGRVENTDTILLDIDKYKIISDEVLELGKEAEIGPESMDDLSFTRETAAGKLRIVDDALDYVAGARAELGAQQNRLQSAISNLGTAIENTESTNSQIRDVDFAAETARLTQMKILNQAGAQVLANANTLPEVALSLLR